jgi:hypothetical protein
MRILKDICGRGEKVFPFSDSVVVKRTLPERPLSSAVPIKLRRKGFPSGNRRHEIQFLNLYE